MTLAMLIQKSGLDKAVTTTPATLTTREGLNTGNGRKFPGIERVEEAAIQALFT